MKGGKRERGKVPRAQWDPGKPVLKPADNCNIT